MRMRASSGAERWRSHDRRCQSRAECQLAQLLRLLTNSWQLWAVFIVSVSNCLFTLAQANDWSSNEINTVLMESTFRISGPSAKTPGEISYGSAFIVGLPVPNSPDRLFYVLVTAAHVLDEIKGETATILLRSHHDIGYLEKPISFRIRTQFYNLYYKSAEADVAVAFFRFPAGFYVHPVPVSFFVTDERIKELALHPGDELFALGFPLYASLNTFPVLRSGILSSYPLTPMKVVREYYLNFRVFPGNSGGPVY